MNLKDKFCFAKVIYTENVDTMSAMAAQFSRQDKKCLCFLRDVSSETFTQKLLCALADVAYEKTQDGSIDEAEWARLVIAANQLASSSLQIDSGAMTDEEILEKCKSLPPSDVVLILPLAKE